MARNAAITHRAANFVASCTTLLSTPGISVATRTAVAKARTAAQQELEAQDAPQQDEALL